jgi:hypothetical protein
VTKIVQIKMSHEQPIVSQPVHDHPSVPFAPRIRRVAMLLPKFAAISTAELSVLSVEPQCVLVRVGGEGFVRDFVEAGQVDFQVVRLGVFDGPEVG